MKVQNIFQLVKAAVDSIWSSDVDEVLEIRLNVFHVRIQPSLVCSIRVGQVYRYRHGRQHLKDWKRRQGDEDLELINF